MVLKLPTLLEGEALAIWLELTTDEQKDYMTMKKKIIDAIKPMSFISLDGESLFLYIHELKQLLNQAMPDTSAQTMEQLLLHLFLKGLPIEVSKQLCATGATDTLKTAVKRAKTLMTVEQHAPANPLLLLNQNLPWNLSNYNSK